MSEELWVVIANNVCCGCEKPVFIGIASEEEARAWAARENADDPELGCRAMPVSDAHAALIEENTE